MLLLKNAVEGVSYQEPYKWINCTNLEGQYLIYKLGSGGFTTDGDYFIFIMDPQNTIVTQNAPVE